MGKKVSVRSNALFNQSLASQLEWVDGKFNLLTENESYGSYKDLIQNIRDIEPYIKKEFPDLWAEVKDHYFKNKYVHLLSDMNNVGKHIVLDCNGLRNKAYAKGEIVLCNALTIDDDGNINWDDEGEWNDDSVCVEGYVHGKFLHQKYLTILHNVNTQTDEYFTVYGVCDESYKILREIANERKYDYLTSLNANGYLIE